MTKNTALKRVVSAPYLVWAALFIVVPLIFVVYYSLVDAGGAFTLDYIRSIGRYKDIMLNSICSRSCSLGVSGRFLLSWTSAATSRKCSL